MKMRIFFSAFMVILLAFSGLAQRYDIVIQNGKIVDGSGNPWFVGDIGIRKGEIKDVGQVSTRRAKRVIDAQGQVVAPGFIDVHAHVESSILTRPLAENFLYDGVTTLVTGNCGGSELDLDQFFDTVEKNGVSLNVASLIGHNTVRRAVLQEENRAPSAAELEQMKALVDQAMADGAVGLSTGLIYVPGTFAETDEIVALAEVAAAHGGVYASHIRNEDHRVFDAIDEAVEIGKQANIPVEISHFKITGKRSWGSANELTERILSYRRQGIDVTVDQYPYTASSTSLAVLLPTWSLGGGRDSLNIRLENPETRAKIEAEMRDMLAEMGFGNYDFAVVANCRWEPTYNGKSISEINLLRGNAASLDNEIQTILDMMTKKQRVQMVYHKMNEQDVQHIMRFPYAMVASDAGIPAFGRGAPHPRAYGTNARVLGRYVREQGITNLEDAIRKMTSLPASRFNLHDRGLLREGMAADIVIFDPEKITDKATFKASHAYSEGVSYVLVNGEPVIENGSHNQRKPGQTLRKESPK